MTRSLGMARRRASGVAVHGEKLEGAAHGCEEKEDTLPRRGGRCRNVLNSAGLGKDCAAVALTLV